MLFSGDFFCGGTADITFFLFYIFFFIYFFFFSFGMADIPYIFFVCLCACVCVTGGGGGGGVGEGGYTSCWDPVYVEDKIQSTPPRPTGSTPHPQ